MAHLHRALAAAALLIAVAAPAGAQAGPDPSGHWEGALTGPMRDIAIQIDIAKNTAGQLVGTITIPEQRVQGLPLASVRVAGEALTFDVRASGGGSFSGTFGDDGATISGDFAASMGTLPFALVRKGAPHIDAPPSNAPVGKEIEGTWRGVVDVDGQQLRLVLTLANQPDGTAQATIVSVDEGGLELPVALAQQERAISFEVRELGGTYAGTLNAAGTEVVGTYSQHGVDMPLTFRR